MLSSALNYELLWKALSYTSSALDHKSEKASKTTAYFALSTTEVKIYSVAQ